MRYTLLILILFLYSCNSRVIEIVHPKDLAWVTAFGVVLAVAILHSIIGMIRRYITYYKKRRF